MPAKLINLDVIDSGGWRRVMTFDAVDDMDSADVMYHAAQLLRWSTNARLRARLIIPGDSGPLMTWTAADGWREWVHPTDRVPAA